VTLVARWTHDAKEALARARAAVESTPGGFATIEERIVVQRGDVSAMTIYEAGPVTS
jgi:hypothetical protein